MLHQHRWESRRNSPKHLSFLSQPPLSRSYFTQPCADMTWNESRSETLGEEGAALSAGPDVRKVPKTKRGLLCDDAPEFCS